MYLAPHLRRLLELQVLGVTVHLLFQPGDELAELFGVEPAVVALGFGHFGLLAAAGGAGLAAADVDEVADGLGDAPPDDAVLGVVGLFPAPVRRASGVAGHTAEPQVLLERVEVTVRVQQVQFVDDAARRDHRIDGLAYRQTQGAQSAVVARCFDGHVFAAHRDDGQVEQQPAHFVEFLVRAAALQYLGQDQVTHRQRDSAEQRVELVGLRRRRTPQVVHPDA